MEQTIQERFKGITGNTLKMIAIVTMMIDHTAVALLEGGLFGFPDGDQMTAVLAQEWSLPFYIADMVSRTVGRIAFPIFCFLLVEGFLHTRNVKKYAGRLFLFALVSEIPFDFAVFGTPFYWGYQNVYFTLLIGLAVLYGYSYFQNRVLPQTCVMIAGCGAAMVLKTDYDMTGVVMILLLYLFRGNKRYQTIWGGLLAAAESLTYYGTAALAFIPIRLYRGERGTRNLKYFFYAFYPIHLLILGLIRMVMQHG